MKDGVLAALALLLTLAVLALIGYLLLTTGVRLF